MFGGTCDLYLDTITSGFDNKNRLIYSPHEYMYNVIEITTNDGDVIVGTYIDIVNHPKSIVLENVTKRSDILSLFNIVKICMDDIKDFKTYISDGDIILANNIKI